MRWYSPKNLDNLMTGVSAFATCMRGICLWLGLVLALVALSTLCNNFHQVMCIPFGGGSCGRHTCLSSTFKHNGGAAQQFVATVCWGPWNNGYAGIAAGCDADPSKGSFSPELSARGQARADEIHTHSAAHRDPQERRAPPVILVCGSCGCFNNLDLESCKK